MPSGQGSSSGRGPGGGPKPGPQGGSVGGPSTSGPAAVGPSTGTPPPRQGAAIGPGVSGTSPTHMGAMGSQQSTQADAPFETDETTGGPVAPKKGCGCCAGVLTAMIGVTIVAWAYLSL